MDKLIKSIKELSKTPRGKGILFFAFYLVFFAFVFLFINLTDSTLTYGDDYELQQAQMGESLEKLEKLQWFFAPKEERKKVLFDILPDRLSSLIEKYHIQLNYSLNSSKVFI